MGRGRGRATEAGLLRGQTAPPPKPQNKHLESQTLEQKACICVQRACREGAETGLQIGLYIHTGSVEKGKTPVLEATTER